MPLDGTELADYEEVIREELKRYGEDDLMQYFDGSILLNEDEFNNLIQYHEKLGKFIVTMVNDEKLPKIIKHT